MNPVELEDAIDSYNNTINYSQPHEYPSWVIAIHKALEGDESLLRNYPPYVRQVFESVKVQQQASSSDEFK